MGNLNQRAYVSKDSIPLYIHHKRVLHIRRATTLYQKGITIRASTNVRSPFMKLRTTETNYSSPFGTNQLVVFVGKATSRQNLTSVQIKKCILLEEKRTRVRILGLALPDETERIEEGKAQLVFLYTSLTRPANPFRATSHRNKLFSQANRFSSTPSQLEW